LNSLGEYCAMVQPKLLSAFCVFATMFFNSAVVLAQSATFPGTRIGNYAGLQAAVFNPAEVADSRYKFDLNLLGFNLGVANNKASFSLGSVLSTFSSDDALSSLFSGDGRISGQIQFDLLGPSLLVSLKNKSGLALTSRLRGQFTVTDLDGKLAKSIANDLNNEIIFPYTISSGNNMRINTNAWAEYGLTYGRVLMESGDHFLKGGLTVKYLAGAGNSYLQIDNLSGTLINPPLPNSSIYLAPGSRGTIGLGISGNTGSFSPGDLLKSASTGLGFDLGLVYERRTENNLRHPYKYKLSISVLDIGSIKYNRDLSRSGTFSMQVVTLPGFDLATLQASSFADYKQILSSNPNFTAAANNNIPTLKVTLPTSLQVYGDLHLKGNLYVSAGTQLSIVNRSNPENPFVYSSFSVIPRYEGKGLGLYVPVNYNSLSQLAIGTTLRLGPLYVGSGSILSALFSKSKQADVHLGLRIGFLKSTKTLAEETVELLKNMGPSN